MDLSILLDTGFGDDVAIAEWHIMRNFTKHLIDFLDLGMNRMRVAMMSFAMHPKLEFYLNDYFKPGLLKKHIDTIRDTGEGSSMTSGIQHIKEWIFNSNAGDRPKVPNVVLIITDDRPLEQDVRATEGLQVVIVGLREYEENLEEMAGDNGITITVDGIRAMDRQVARIVTDRTKNLHPITCPPG